MSNFSCSLTNNSTSPSTKNLAFHTILRWKMIALPILTTSLIHFLFKRFGECTFWELGSERVKKTERPWGRFVEQYDYYDCLHSTETGNIIFFLFFSSSYVHFSFTWPCFFSRLSCICVLIIAAVAHRVHRLPLLQMNYSTEYRWFFLNVLVKNLWMPSNERVFGGVWTILSTRWLQILVLRPPRALYPRLCLGQTPNFTWTESNTNERNNAFC